MSNKIKHTYLYDQGYTLTLKKTHIYPQYHTQKHYRQKPRIKYSNIGTYTNQYIPHVNQNNTFHKLIKNHSHTLYSQNTPIK